MLREILEKMEADIESVFKKLEKELKIKITYAEYEDGFVEFEYKGKIFSLIQDSEGMSYSIKITNEDGEKLIASKKCLDKDGWYDLDCIKNLIITAEDLY